MPSSRSFGALASTLSVLIARALPAAAAPALFAIAAPAQAQSSVPSQQYERRELKIPVRDGTKLFAIALIPKDARGPLPIILTRTPFDAGRAFRDTTVPNSYRELAEDGYIFVVDMDGVELVNPVFPNLEGRNLLDLKDTGGKLLIRDMLKVVRTDGSGWVDYMWPRPGASVSTRKSTYVRRARMGDR
jgi:hypothetical protein